MLVNLCGPPGAPIFLVGEAPGEEEDRIGLPFQGRAGTVLNILLAQAGIARNTCLIKNVAKLRPQANKISHFFFDSQCTNPKPELVEWIEELRQEIVSNKPNVVVAMGATALWALTGEKKISKFRGYVMESTLVPGQKVFATYHPQAVGYDWKLAFYVIMDFVKAKYHSGFPQLPVSKTHPKEAMIEEFITYLEWLVASPEIEKVAFDLETTSPGCHPSVIGFAHSKSEGVSFRLLMNGYPTIPEREELLLWQAVARVLAQKKCIIQSALFDASVMLQHLHIYVRKLVMDTLIGAHVCWPECPRDLGFLASICLDTAPWKHTSKEDQVIYNCLDAINDVGIEEFLWKEIARQGVEKTFNFEMSEIEPAIYMQLRGLKINEEERVRLLEKANTDVADTGAALKLLTGRDINFNAPKQIQQLLYIDLGFPVQYHRRKSVEEERKISVDAKALKMLSIKFPKDPVFNLVLAHKRAIKLRSFFKIKLSPEGRVHSSFNVTGSSEKAEGKDEGEGQKSFSRWSSSKSIILPYGNGNLYNIPPQARKMYVADKGKVLVQADYVQAEAVVVAYLINDTRLKRLFKDRFNAAPEDKEKYDVHRTTASMMFGVAEAEVTPELRKIGKTLRHACNYSAGPMVLATRLNCEMADAKKFLQSYHNMCPQLQLWYGRVQEELRKTRTLTNLLGRKHRFLGRFDDELFRSAYAYNPQSTVGDLLNASMVSAYRFYKMDIWLTLYDAIYIQCSPTETAEAKETLRSVMLRPLTYNYETFTIDVDFKVGENWGEMTTL